MKKLLIILICLGFSGCATVPQPDKGIVPYVANFNYTPEKQAAPSGEITFTLINTAFETQNHIMWFLSPQFENLPKALKEDLPEIIVAKGFNILGPYDTYDLIPFSDKKKIDFLLIPKFKLIISLKDPKAELESMWTAPPVHDLSGEVLVNGEITIELREIVTRELMWVKTIPFKESAFPYFFRIPSYAEGSPFNYALVMNDIVKAVEQQYPDIMGTVYSLLDPEEMKIMKKQAQDIKSKQGY